MSPDPPEIAEYERPDDARRDGIGEEDNPIPLWFNVGFYGCIVFGVLYIVWYTLLSDWSSASMYAAEVSAARKEYAAASPAPAETNPYHGDAAAIAEGAQTFKTICAACHKPDGSGLVGPSLVDPYWKYGHSDQDLFETVSAGRPGGMPAWKPMLGTDKIWKVLAYVETLPKSDRPGVGAPGYTAPAAATPAAGAPAAAAPGS
jgi:cytochrome c oxidase cbb3-type subunit III